MSNWVKFLSIKSFKSYFWFLHVLVLPRGAFFIDSSWDNITLCACIHKKFNLFFPIYFHCDCRLPFLFGFLSSYSLYIQFFDFIFIVFLLYLLILQFVHRSWSIISVSTAVIREMTPLITVETLFSKCRAPIPISLVKSPAVPAFVIERCRLCSIFLNFVDVYCIFYFLAKHILCFICSSFICICYIYSFFKGKFSIK